MLPFYLGGDFNEKPWIIYDFGSFYNSNSADFAEMVTFLLSAELQMLSMYQEWEISMSVQLSFSVMILSDGLCSFFFRYSGLLKLGS